MQYAQTCWKNLLLILVTLALIFGILPSTQAQQKLFSGPAITGTMDIDFATRQRVNQDSEGKPNKGVSDTYNVDLKVGALQFKGKIVRTPRIINLLNMEKQRGQIFYKIALFVLPPNAKPVYVGDWLGTVVTNDKGAYIWNGMGDPDSKPRIQVQSVGNQTAFTDYFGGIMLGKGSAASNNPVTFLRNLGGGKKATYTATNTDPMDNPNRIL